MEKPIYKYTEALQKLSGSKIKPEPWMHFASVKGQYIIYVWDTRAILDSGKVDTEKVVTAKAPFAIDNGTPVNGKDAELFNATLFAAPMKLRCDVHYTPMMGGRTTKDYFVNDTHVCQTEEYVDLFCKISRDGTPERIRSVSKKAKSTQWDIRGLLELFSDSARDVIRKHADNYYPDLRYGYQGKAMTKSEIMAVLQRIKNELA